jgi:acetyltransferase-like isoleucine patch superfamily enzyme
VQALLGAGAVARPGIAIGADAVVAPGAALAADVPAGARMGGVPARPI